MTTLPERLRRALSLPEPHEHTSHTVYAGHMFENERLRPIHERLIACCVALEYLQNEQQPLIAKTLTALSEVLEKMEGK